MRIGRIACIPFRERSQHCNGFGTVIIIENEYERYYSEIELERTVAVSYECSSETCFMFRFRINGVELKEESEIKAIMRPVYAKSTYMLIDLLATNLAL